MRCLLNFETLETLKAPEQPPRLKADLLFVLPVRKKLRFALVVEKKRHKTEATQKEVINGDVVGLDRVRWEIVVVAERGK